MNGAQLCVRDCVVECIWCILDCYFKNSKVLEKVMKVEEMWGRKWWEMSNGVWIFEGLVFGCNFFWGRGRCGFGDINTKNMFNFSHNIKSSIK